MKLQYFTLVFFLFLYGLAKAQTADTDINKKQGDLYFSQKEYGRAIEKYSQSSVSIKDTSNRSYVAYLEYLAKFGLCYYYIGDFDNAIKKFKQGESIYCNSCRKTAAYAAILNNLANAYIEIYQYSKAEVLLKKSIEIKRKTSTAGTDYAIGLINLADLYNTMGNYFNAEPLYKQALNALETAGETATLTYAIALNNLAEIFSSSGSHTVAVNLYRKSIKVKESLEIAEPASLASGYINLATALLKQGKIAEAEPIFLKGLKIKAETESTESVAYAAAMLNYSELFVQKGDFSKAITINESALKLISKEPKQTRIDFQTALGVKYLKKGMFSKADSIFKLINADFQSLQEKPSGYAAFSMYYAQVLLANGKAQEADSKVEMAVNMKSAEINKTFKYLSEKEKNSFLDKNEPFFNSYLKYCLTRTGTLGSEGSVNSTFATRLLDFRINNKALALTSAARLRKVIFDSPDTVLKSKFAQWEDMRQIIALAQNQKNDNSYQTKIQALTDKSSKLEAELYTLSDSYKKLFQTNNIGFEALKNMLLPNEACVEIIKLKIAKDTIGYFALVFDSKSAVPVVVQIPNGNALEKRYLKYYRNSIKLKEEDTESYGAFWKPIAKAINSGITKIYISPDGIYNVINIATLKNPVSGKYIVEEAEIHRFTTLKDLYELKSKPKTNEIVTTATLYGRPQYFENATNTAQSLQQLERSTGTSLTDIPFSDLPGTESEINQINTILTSGSVKTEKFIKADATEATFKKENDSQVIHVATHGYFIPESGFNDKESMLRSGIVLAGVNPNAENDGLLTAYELSSMDFSKAQLIAFSACETGLGEVKNGEGVYGLQRAAILAGAKSVLMSLWTVDDQATKDLMVAFYSQWMKTKNKREALRQAQLQMLAKYKHPYYWGAFVMIGE